METPPLRHPPGESPENPLPQQTAGEALFNPEDGLMEDAETHVHWLLPVVGVLVLMALSLAGARWFWLFVLSQEG